MAGWWSMWSWVRWVWQRIGDVQTIYWIYSGLSIAVSTITTAWAWVSNLLPAPFLILFGVLVFAVVMFGLNQFDLWRRRQRRPPSRCEAGQTDGGRPR